MSRPYFVVVSGPPPMDITGHTGFVHHIFAPTGSPPELTIHSGEPETVMRSARVLASRRPTVRLSFYQRQGLGMWRRLVGKLHLSDLLVRPTPAEVAAIVKAAGNPRAVLVVAIDHYLLLYAERLLRHLPDVGASIFIVDDPLGAGDTLKDPVFKARLERGFANLLRRCEGRFVISDLFKRNYEDRFGISFSVLLPPASDEYFEEARRWPPYLPESADGATRVMLAGTVDGARAASLHCLAGAFRHVAATTGKSPTLVYAGPQTLSTIQQYGFHPRHVEHVGWISRRQVIELAYRSTCSFAPGVFEHKYRHLFKSFSGRISDLLTGGSPIVAHHPLFAAVGAHFAQHELPFPCHQLDERALGEILVQVGNLSAGERERLRQRYHGLVERFHLASALRRALLAER